LAQDADSSASRPLSIIFDGSNSMWGELPDASRKIEVAKEVFADLDPTLFENREVSLRIYGHRRAGDCSDIELAVPLAPAARALATMAERIDGVTPRGKTPITRSLQAARDDLGDREGDILLISDGIETCDPDPAIWCSRGEIPESAFVSTSSASD
jgi:Ca-activated chloride channel family protein